MVKWSCGQFAHSVGNEVSESPSRCLCDGASATVNLVREYYPCMASVVVDDRQEIVLNEFSVDRFSFIKQKAIIIV